MGQMKKKLWGLFVLTLLLAGCVNGKWKEKYPLEIADPATLEAQVNLAKYSALLRTKELNKVQRTELLYARGNIYAQLGLDALAFADFSLVIKLDPLIPDPYNYLGALLAASDEYDDAFEAFDSAIELDPTYFFAYLNRGIALVNNHRYYLARKDFRVFNQNNPDTPVGLIWLYFTEREMLGKKEAKANLKQHYDALKDKHVWGCNIIEFYLGIISEKTLLETTKLQKDNVDASTYAGYLSEVYFYLGKYYLGIGDKESATTLFKLTLANNVKHFIEYHQARVELNKIQSDIAN